MIDAIVVEALTNADLESVGEAEAVGHRRRYQAKKPGSTFVGEMFIQNDQIGLAYAMGGEARIREVVATEVVMLKTRLEAQAQ